MKTLLEFQTGARTLKALGRCVGGPKVEYRRQGVCVFPHNGDLFAAAVNGSVVMVARIEGEAHTSKRLWIHSTELDRIKHHRRVFDDAVAFHYQGGSVVDVKADWFEGYIKCRGADEVGFPDVMQGLRRHYALWYPQNLYTGAPQFDAGVVKAVQKACVDLTGGVLLWHTFGDNEPALILPGEDVLMMALPIMQGQRQPLRVPDWV